MPSQQELKHLAAQAAFDYVSAKLHKDSILGIGTGSTTNCFIALLEPLVGHIAGVVSSSEATTRQLQDMGLEVFSLNEVASIDFYVDGADEVDEDLNLLKGGGAALTREKIVASVSKEFICIVDESKCSIRLGRFPLAVEVIPMARSAVARKLVTLGASPVYRENVTTDNGNIILDCYDFAIPQAFETERTINNIPGVVCNGIFSQQAAHRVIISTAHGIETKVRST